MIEKRIPIKPNVKVVIKAHKHADLLGHKLSEVLVTPQGPSEIEVQIQEEENSLHLEMFTEGIIRVPTEAQIQIERIGGHGKVNGLRVGIFGAQVGGHLVARDTGPISLEHVGGHAEVRHIEGDLHLDHVGGHLKVGPSTGHVSALHVGGHAELVDVMKGCNLPEVGGHAKLEGVKGSQRVNAGGNVKTHIDPLPDLSYELKAGGTLTCDLPSAANAVIHMKSPGIDSRTNSTRTMGNGSAQLRLSAGGPILLTEDGSSAQRDQFKRVFREKVRAAQAKAKAKVQEVLDENNLTPDSTADLQEQFAEIAHEAVEVVKEISDDMQEKAREVWKQGTKSKDTPSKEAETVEAESERANSAKAEERKMILRMLAEAKITVEEASDLLEALN